MLIKKYPALTMVELLITLSIFAVVATLSTVVISDAIRSARRIQTQVFLYTEAQALADRISRAIETHAIDYETYFGRQVLYDSMYTENYGQYEQSFYNPGQDGPYSEGPYEKVDGYGAYCPDGSDSTYPRDCDVPIFEQVDVNTGAHPFTGIWGYPNQPEDMNAFCSEAEGAVDCRDFEHHVVQDLFLVNAAGDERLIFSHSLRDVDILDEFEIVQSELFGVDTDNDGLVDTWNCTDRYPNCVPPIVIDTEPIHPTALDVDDFYVYITPTEDPYRAFAESQLSIQPQVTFYLKVTLSDSYGSNLVGDSPSISIQRTVSTGVTTPIQTYANQ